MAESVAIDVAIDVATSLASKLLTLLVQEAKSLSGVHNEVQYIADTLRAINSFLLRAEERPESVDGAQGWIRQLRELSYDIEDCIDDYFVRVGRRHDRRGLSRLPRRVATMPARAIARHSISDEIHRIKSRLDELKLRRDIFFLSAGVPPQPPPLDGSSTSHHSSSSSRAGGATDPRLGALFVEESELVGMDEPRQELTRWLLADGRPPLHVVAVVGMGGLGKTTLVRRVYESSSITEARFHSIAWITVSQSMDLPPLLRDMIRQTVSPLPDRLEEVTNVTTLIEMVRSHLRDKKYLIVLDDLWTVAHWNAISSSLPSSSLGGRVIVTTRNEPVAHTCCSNGLAYVYNLQPLTPELSWDLFCKRAFPHPHHRCPPELNPLSHQILRKCAGLPLAVVTIGALLASKRQKTEMEWKKLHDSLGSEMERNPSLEGMTRILNLSYEDLPPHLKRCFLYLSIFPEDCVIGRSRLVFHWVAQGIVRGGEELANSYLNDLVSRSMVQPTELMLDGTVRSFRVHDIVRELIVSKSMEEMNILVINTITDLTRAGRYIRHLSILPGDADLGIINPSRTLRTTSVRSLSIFNERSMSSFMPPTLQMKMLSVLDMEGCRDVRVNLLDSIGELLHLKYLSLRGLRGFTLPVTIARLRNLETLDMRDGEGEGEIPSVVFELKMLRHLLFSAHHFSDLECPGIHLIGESIRLSRNIRNLKSIQTMYHVIGKRCGPEAMEELGKLTQLRKLGVVRLTEDQSADFCAALEKLSGSLRSLTVCMDSAEEGVKKMDAMESQPLQLQTLKLGGRVQSLPRWVSSLRNLTKMVIYGYDLTGNEPLRAVSALPNLLDLRIYVCGSVREVCFGEEGFERLRSLTVRGWMSSFERLRFREGAAPSLERLRFVEYHEGRNPPRGMIYLTSLKQVFVHGSYVEYPALTRALEEHPNHPKLTRVSMYTHWNKVLP